MTPAEVAATLRQFNGWRRDFDDKFEQPDPQEVSEAIDAAVEMIDRLEAAEKERDAAELMSLALRAKVAEMEQQEPVGFLDGDGCAILQRKLEPWEDLYALPGAQPAPIVPDGWKLVPIMLAAATESKPCP